MQQATNPGEVEITLGGVTHVLKPSLRAARAVNSISGGFIGALRGISSYDFEVMASIVIYGLDVRSQKELEATHQQVYEAGLANLAGPLSRYVEMLTNGGKPLQANEERSAEGNGASA